MKNPTQQFANILRVANCLSYSELKIIFGQDVDHYVTKLERKGLAGFIMYLDNDNLKTYMAFVTNKHLKQQEKYGA
tara:strand:- start:30990 stop:31217 length:228 start_codon:yes stop_codon:yes gene_type:complete